MDNGYTQLINLIAAQAVDEWIDASDQRAESPSAATGAAPAGGVHNITRSGHGVTYQRREPADPRTIREQTPAAKAVGHL